MRAVALSIMGVVIALASEASLAGGNSTENGATCAAAETVAGAAEYNELTCAGIDLMKRGAYAEAAKRFDRALQISLFEQPNFKLLPRLALAQFRAGDRERGRVTIDAAELSLSVLVGVVRCVEKDNGFSLLNASGLPVRSTQEGRVASRMCGAAYDDYYVRPTLESFVRDSDLIRYFLEVREEIERSR